MVTDGKVLSFLLGTKRKTDINWKFLGEKNIKKMIKNKCAKKVSKIYYNAINYLDEKSHVKGWHDIVHIRT